MTVSLEYLAGFFDGEGCVYYRARRPDASVLDMRIVVTNTDRTILEEFERRFGGRITVKTDDPKRTKDCFQWVGWSRHGLKAMKQLAPYLILKKRKAEVFIKLYETIRPERGSGSVSRIECKLRRELLSLCA